jgi:N-acyl-L-homoserine lactone synthetase
MSYQLYLDRPEDCFRLRHQVYCVDHQWEVGHEGLEFDEFDSHSTHLLLEDFGTARIIEPPLPMAAHIDIPDNAVEISRFCLTKDAPEDAVLHLMDALLKHTQDKDYWVCWMRPALIRLLSSHGFYFNVVGDIMQRKITCTPTSDIDRRSLKW